MAQDWKAKLNHYRGAFIKVGWWVVIGILLVVVALILNFISIDKYVAQAELLTYDWRVNLLRKNVQPSKDIIIIKFDEPSTRYLNADFGEWPFPRRIYGDMIEFLNEAGARVIAFDMLFVSPHYGREASDEHLGKIFGANKNVVTSMYFDTDFNASMSTGNGVTPEQIRLIEPAALNVNSELSPNQNEFKVDDIGMFLNPAMNYDSFRPIILNMLKYHERFAFVNHGVDIDGISRSNPLFFRFHYTMPERTDRLPLHQDKGQWYDADNRPVSADGDLLNAQGQVLINRQQKFFPYLSLATLINLKYQGKSPDFKITADGHVDFDNYHIPLTQDGTVMLNWYNVNVQRDREAARLKELQTQLSNVDTNADLAPHEKPQVKLNLQNQISQIEQYLLQPFFPMPYEEIPAWNVFTAIKNYNNGNPTANDVMLHNFMKDKIIFVGITAAASHDIRSTPIQKALPGVIIPATFFDNIYQNNGFMHRATNMQNGLLAVILCILSTALTFRVSSVKTEIILAVGIALLYIGGAFYVFWADGLWINIVIPLCILLLTQSLTFTFKNIARSKAYMQAYALANTDSMTGLYNHRFFTRQMQVSQEKATRAKGKFSLILIDIDFFKKFNDTHGHQAGDEVLRCVAQKLKTTVRGDDMVVRYGGEEMAVILDKTDEREALAVAKKLVEAIGAEAYPIAEGVSKHVTISVGVSTFPTNGKNMKDLVEFADQGLYRAKENGRNQVGAQYDSPEAKTAAENAEATASEQTVPPEENSDAG